MKTVELPRWDANRAFREVTEARPRSEAHQKVTGSARYAADITLPGQLHAAVVRSPHPHARLRSLDATTSRSIPGIDAVLTGDDVDVRWYDEQVPILPRVGDVVRFVGDEVAVVVADSVHAARRGARAVAAEYEELPHVTDATDSISHDAPAIHAGGNRVEDDEVTERGDAEAGMALAAVVVEGCFRTPAAVHNALESHGCTAEWDGDHVTLYASTQGVNAVRDTIAERLGLDHNQVRVVADHVGGGFGAKQVPWKPAALAALASRHCGRPVQLLLDRRAENLAGGKRNGSVQNLRLGADENGHLVAIDADLTADIGAYGVAGEASILDGLYLHLYACENVRTISRKVRTNTGPAVAFRAPGYVEAAFALESAMDELARRLDLDPVELRRRNLTGRDQQADKPLSSPDALPTCYQRIEEAGWLNTPPGPGRSTTGEVVRGRGFAAHEWAAGKANPPGYAWMELNRDGSAHVVTSTQDIGTGTRTALTQVVAEELGMDPARIRLTLGDTGAGPPAPTSAGSATLPTMAPAVRAAAHDVARQVREAAAEQLDRPVAELRFEGHAVRGDGVELALTDLLGELAPEGIHGHGGRIESTDDASVRTFGAASADVEVDTATGEVRVIRLVVAPDCGRIVNPLLVDSQVIGGATQGIGFALTEEQVVDHERGWVVNSDLEEYLLPTISDTCEIVHAAVDIPDLVANPLGVKGIGEPPLIGVPAAISNAVRDATGIRFHELPITRRRMLDAIAQQLTEEAGT